MILNDKFLSQCASDIRIKLRQLQQQDPAASSDEMVQTATNSFYNREQENPSSRFEGTSTQRREEKSAPVRRRERRELWLLFLYVFLSLGLSYVNWASQEYCLFYVRFSLRSSDFPLFYFVGFSLPGLLATAILDSFSLS